MQRHGRAPMYVFVCTCIHILIPLICMHAAKQEERSLRPEQGSSVGQACVGRVGDGLLEGGLLLRGAAGLRGLHRLQGGGGDVGGGAGLLRDGGEGLGGCYLHFYLAIYMYLCYI
jgi:hypothetical protein